MQHLKKNVSRRLKVTDALPFWIGVCDNLNPRLFEQNSDSIFLSVAF